MKEKFATLASLANGEASKIFGEELEKLLANVADGRFPAGGKEAYPVDLELAATHFGVVLKKLEKELSPPPEKEKASKARGRKK